MSSLSCGPAVVNWARLTRVTGCSVSQDKPLLSWLGSVTYWYHRGEQVVNMGRNTAQGRRERTHQNSVTSKGAGKPAQLQRRVLEMRGESSSLQLELGCRGVRMDNTISHRCERLIWVFPALSTESQCQKDHLWSWCAPPGDRVPESALIGGGSLQKNIEVCFISLFCWCDKHYD